MLEHVLCIFTEHLAKNLKCYIWTLCRHTFLEQAVVLHLAIDYIKRLKLRFQRNGD